MEKNLPRRCYSTPPFAEEHRRQSSSVAIYSFSSNDNYMDYASYSYRKDFWFLHPSTAATRSRGIRGRAHTIVGNLTFYYLSDLRREQYFHKELLVFDKLRWPYLFASLNVPLCLRRQIWRLKHAIQLWLLSLLSN